MVLLSFLDRAAHRMLDVIELLVVRDDDIAYYSSYVNPAEGHITIH